MTLTDTDFAEQAESYLPGESYFEEGEGESEAYDEESSAAERRRRRARRAVLERRNRAAAMNAQRRRVTGMARPQIPATPRTPATAARAAVAAVERLDIETKVQDDELRGRLAAQERRTSRSEMAAVAAVASGQLQASFQDRFPELRNPFARAALAYAPLLLLSPQKKGTGAGALVSDPRAIGAALVLGLAVVGDRLKKSDETVDIRLVGAPEVEVGRTTILVADALDGRGAVLGGQTPIFESSNRAIAEVDPETGEVTAKAVGPVVITASLDNVVRRIVLTVTSTLALAQLPSIVQPIPAPPSPATADIRLVGPDTVAVGAETIFIADALDSSGAIIPNKDIDFESSEKKIATIGPKSGQVRGVKAGAVVISARVDGIERRTVLTVT